MTHLFKRFDVDTTGTGDFWESNDGDWVLAQDAIDREAVNAAKIATLEAQLKAAKQSAASAKSGDAPDCTSQIAIVVKDLIGSLLIWNGQASAGLDVRFLAGLRDELNQTDDK